MGAIVKGLLALYLLANTAATPPPPPPEPPPTGAATPASIGAPHVCDENQYPVPALQTGTEGTTILGFTITAQGAVTDEGVVQSSGNQYLDNASIACASHWLYKPATRNGAPVEAPWRAMVKWQIKVTEPFLDIDAQSLRCIVSTETGREGMAKATLHPVVRVHFSKGVVSTVTVVGSSGNADFDQRAAGCYASLPPEATAAVTGDVDETFVVMVAPD
jgi:TonB family protein